MKTFADLMNGHKGAEIRCLYSGKLVRRLTVNGDTLRFDAMTVAIDIPLSTPISYEPWVFDRGSLLFSVPNLPDGLKVAKLCGEHDPITFDDGTEGNVPRPE